MRGGRQGCPGELVALGTPGLRPQSWELSPLARFLNPMTKGSLGSESHLTLTKARTHCDQL